MKPERLLFKDAIHPGAIVANKNHVTGAWTFAVLGCVCVSDLLGKPVGRHTQVREAEACAQRVIARGPTPVLGFMRAAGVGCRA